MKTDIVGLRCVINGVKHKVLRDDGRTVLVERTTGNHRGSVDTRWVARDEVFPPAPAAPPYFWLGAQAEGMYR